MTVSKIDGAKIAVAEREGVDANRLAAYNELTTAERAWVSWWWNKKGDHPSAYYYERNARGKLVALRYAKL